MSAVFPVPGSVEELAAFARLQARLPALFERVKSEAAGKMARIPPRAKGVAGVTTLKP